jgi:hypothetical protein
MHSQQAWTVRPLDLGRHALELVTRHGTRITLEWFDGGGFVASHAVWRVDGRVVRVDEAGSA